MVNPEAKLEKKKQFQYIQAISKKTLFPWSFHVLVDWLIIGLCIWGAGTLNHPLSYFIAILIVGNRQHALAILGHDGAHFVIHENKKMNDFLSNIFCFWPLLVTTEGYRKLHLQHHKNTGTTNDPELMHKSARAPQWDLPVTPQKIAAYSAKDLFGYSIPDLIIILTFSRPEKNISLLPVLALHAVVITLFTSAGLWWIALLWYISLATSFMMFFRLRLWIEHQGTGDTQRVHLNWWQKHILAPHNIWLHFEHHRWPTVPYHQLEKAREVIANPKPLTLPELLELFKHTSPIPSGASLKDAL
jgi:fatty acid desaturase